MLDGEAVTAMSHFLGQTPFDWCPKRQATVETATCGAEYLAARTCVGQIRAHRLALMHLGVPVVRPGPQRKPCCAGSRGLLNGGADFQPRRYFQEGDSD